MQRSLILKSAVVGAGLVGLAASSSSAAILFKTSFDSTPATPTTSYTAGLALPGQPATAATSQQWSGVVTIGTGGVTQPQTGVFAYSATPGPQYVVLQAANNVGGTSGFFRPNANLPANGGTAYPASTSADKVVDITFNMTVQAAAANSTSVNDEFFGVVAYGANGQISQLGLNNRTGEYVLPAGATIVRSSPFGTGSANLNVNHGYELLLNYANNTWQIYSQLVSGVTPFQLDASGSFQTANTNFTQAALAAYNLGSGTSNGSGIFDDYTVQTTPEPATITAIAAASGLLLGRRRRIV